LSPAFFTDGELAVVAAAAERLLPGAAGWGAAGYIDTLLGAFTFTPPRIWAGGPFSGRHGGAASFDDWIELGPMEELAWRTRIEGSQGRPEREFNGPVAGWQAEYRAGLAALGADFAGVDAAEQDRRLAEAGDFADLLFDHACEGVYGDPVYGGNPDRAAWVAIRWAGDVQPRGYTDDEVSQRDKTEIS
jgi:hypothetical protein